MSAQAPPSDAAFYLYGFVDPGADVAGLRALEDGSAVTVVSVDGVGCAISPVLLEEYQRLIAAPATQIDSIAPRAWRHHEIVMALHQRGGVVPVKFGTLCSTLDGVRAVLRRSRMPIAALLAELRGRDEWTLRTLVDEAALAADLDVTDAGLLALQRDLTDCSNGRAYFVRKQLEQTRRALLGRHVDSLQASLCSRLAMAGWPTAAAPASRRHGIASTEISLLVERPALQRVQSLLDAFEAGDAARHATFELVGPWPPYSFTGTLSVEAVEGCEA